MKLSLIPEYNKTTQPEKPFKADQDSIRIVIGLLGFFLPIILWGGTSILFNYSKPLESISHYFYTRVSSAFIITLGVLAIVLFLYKGKRLIDFIITAVAGFFALCVIAFPTTNLPPELNSITITRIEPDHIYSTFHFISAAIFLLCLAFMSLVRFPKSDSSDENIKPLDKFMYISCGIIMILSMAAIFVGKQWQIFNKPYFDYPYNGTFWGETIAIWAFGYSWLLKAGFFTKFIRVVKLLI